MRVIVGVVLYFGEDLFVHNGPFVDFRVFHSFLVDQIHKILREGVRHVLHPLRQFPLHLLDREIVIKKQRLRRLQGGVLRHIVRKHLQGGVLKHRVRRCLKCRLAFLIKSLSCRLLLLIGLLRQWLFIPLEEGLQKTMLRRFFGFLPVFPGFFLPILFSALFLDIIPVDVGFQIRIEIPAHSGRCFIKDHQINQHLRLQKERMDLIHRDPHPFFLGIPKAACGNERKSYGSDAVFLCECQALPVTGSEKRLLALVTIDEQGTYGMDDVFCRKVESGGDERVAFLDAADVFLPISEQFVKAGRLINSAVASRADNGVRICRVDDGIRFHLGNIVSYNLKWHSWSPFY